MLLGIIVKLVVLAVVGGLFGLLCLIWLNTRLANWTKEDHSPNAPPGSEPLIMGSAVRAEPPDVGTIEPEHQADSAQETHSPTPSEHPNDDFTHSLWPST